MKHDRTLAQIVTWLRRIDEAAVTDVVARTAPWLAPLPTAYVVYGSLDQHLDWPIWVRVVAAVVVETLGLSAVNTALTFFQHNRGLKEGDKRRAPFGLAAVLVGAYLFVVLGLTVFLDTMPVLAHLASGIFPTDSLAGILLDILPELAVHLAPVVFPLNSLIGVGLLALRASHRQQVEEMILSQAAPYNKKKHRMIRDRLLAEMDDQGSVADNKGDQGSVTDGQSDQGSVGGRSKSGQETTIDTWRAIASGLNGQQATITTADVIELLEESGYEPPAKSTARRWARLTRRGEL